MIHATPGAGACRALTAAVTAALLAARPCAAEEPPPPRGFELSLGIGVAHVLGEGPPAVGEDGNALATDAHLGLRVTRRTAFGVHLGGMFLAPSGRYRDEDATALSAGVYLRVYVAPRPERLGLDPWVGLDVDFVGRAWTGTERPYGSSVASSFEGRGWLSSLRAGLDYRLTQRLAVGVAAAVTAWSGLDICSTIVTADRTQRRCFREYPEVEFYGGTPGFALSLSATVNVRYLFPR